MGDGAVAVATYAGAVVPADKKVSSFYPLAKENYLHNLDRRIDLAS